MTGVDDFHNDHGKDSHEHAAGIVPHNGNVGNVVFEYSKNNDSSGFRDDVSFVQLPTTTQLTLDTA